MEKLELVAFNLGRHELKIGAEDGYRDVGGKWDD